MFCEKCGAEVGSESVFCPKCGQRQMVDEGVVEGLQNSQPSKRRSIWTVLFAVILLAILLAGSVFWVINSQNQKKAESAAAQAAAKASAKEAVDGVGKINAAVSVGVTYQNYMTLLAQSAAAAEAYQPSDTVGIGIKGNLQKAVNFYSTAGTVWNDDIQGAYDGSSYIADSEMNPYISDSSYISADDARQAAWMVASDYFDKAKTALDTFNVKSSPSTASDKAAK